MGIDRTDYIIFGFKLNEKELKRQKINLWDEKYFPYSEGHRNIPYRIIHDHMGGEYTVFGKVINRADDYEGTSFTVINYKDFSDDTQNSQLKEAFISIFGQDQYDALEVKEPQMMVFSHYS